MRKLSFIIATALLFFLCGCTMQGETGPSASVPSEASSSSNQNSEIPVSVATVTEEQKWCEPVAYMPYETKSNDFEPCVCISNHFYYLTPHPDGNIPNTLNCIAGEKPEALLPMTYPIESVAALPDDNLALRIREMDEGSVVVCSYAIYYPKTGMVKAVTPASDHPKSFSMIGMVRENVVFADFDHHQILIQNGAGNEIDSFEASGIAICGDHIYCITADGKSLFSYDVKEKIRTDLQTASDDATFYLPGSGLLMKEQKSTQVITLYNLCDQKKICAYPEIPNATYLTFDSSAGIVYFRGLSGNDPYIYALLLETGNLQKIRTVHDCYRLCTIDGKIFAELWNRQTDLIELYQLQIKDLP